MGRTAFAQLRNIVDQLSRIGGVPGVDSVFLRQMPAAPMGIIEDGGIAMIRRDDQRVRRSGAFQCQTGIAQGHGPRPIKQPYIIESCTAKGEHQ